LDIGVVGVGVDAVGEVLSRSQLRQHLLKRGKKAKEGEDGEDGEE
jgi:hypothetical protein